MTRDLEKDLKSGSGMAFWAPEGRRKFGWHVITGCPDGLLPESGLTLTIQAPFPPPQRTHALSHHRTSAPFFQNPWRIYVINYWCADVPHTGARMGGHILGPDIARSGIRMGETVDGSHEA